MSNFNKRILSIDVLRVASLFMIILTHFNVEMITKRGWGEMIGWYANSYIDLGQIGVGLFMIISGYSLSTRSNSSQSLYFYKKRLLRIFPQFYICYIACLIALMVCNGGVNFSAPPVNFLFTLIGMDGYLFYKASTFYITGEWFLGAILSLYLIFPVLVKVTSRWPVIASTAALIIFYLNHRFYGVLYSIEEWRNLVTMGVLFTMGSSYRFASERFTPLIMLTPLFASFSYLLLFFDVSPVPTKVATAIFLFSAIYSLFEICKLNWISSKIITHIAEVSFSAFLVHHVVISILTSSNRIGNHIHNNYALLCLSIAITLLMGWACYKVNTVIMKGLTSG